MVNSPTGLPVAGSVIVVVNGCVGSVTDVPLISVTSKSSPGFGSVSLVNTLPETGWLISVTLMSSSATGGLSATNRVVVAVLSSPLGSVTVYGTWTVPTKSFSGVNVTSPVVGLTVRTPAGSPLESRIVIGPVVGSCPATSLIVSRSFSGSVSLSNKLPVAGSFLVPATKSSPAFGGSLVAGSSGVTERVTVAESVAPLGSTIV